MAKDSLPLKNKRRLTGLMFFSFLAIGGSGVINN